MSIITHRQQFAIIKFFLVIYIFCFTTISSNYFVIWAHKDTVNKLQTKIENCNDKNEIIKYIHDEDKTFYKERTKNVITFTIVSTLYFIILLIVFSIVEFYLFNFKLE